MKKCVGLDFEEEPEWEHSLAIAKKGMLQNDSAS